MAISNRYRKVLCDASKTIRDQARHLHWVTEAGNQEEIALAVKNLHEMVGALLLQMRRNQTPALPSFTEKPSSLIPLLRSRDRIDTEKDPRLEREAENLRKTALTQEIELADADLRKK